MTDMDNLNKTIADLIEVRVAVARDLATMSESKRGTQWETDRLRELELTDRRLAMLWRGQLATD